jgi:peptide/nickel transport system substrate-binding protein
MHKVVKSALAGIALMVLLVGGMPASGQPVRGGTLTIAIVRDPDTLDIHRTTWVDIGNFLPYDPLVVMDEKGKIIPHLARAWRVSPDGKEITFTLRPGVRFHSGTPFTAEAVKKTYDRARDPATRSPASAFMLGPLEAVDVVDSLTARLRFREPFAPIWAPMITAYLAPFDPVVMDREGLEFGERPSGAGPFRFVERVRGSHLVFRRFDDYAWGPPYVTNKRAPFVETVRLRVIPDEATRMLELDRGGVQIVMSVPTQDVRRLRDRKDVYLIRTRENGITYLGFNNKKWPFTEPKVRHAISMAVQRDHVIRFALEGLANPIYGPLPPTIPGFSEKIEDLSKSRYPFDRRKARALLQEDGWRPGPDGIMTKDGRRLEASLWVTNDPVNQRIGMILQSQLRAIGMQANLEVLEDATIRANTPRGLHEMIVWPYGWFDPDILHALFYTGRSIRVHYSTPELDRLLDAGRTTMDERRRMEIYFEAQRLIVEAAPWVPLYVRQHVIAVRSEVKDVKAHPFTNALILNDAYISDR